MNNLVTRTNNDNDLRNRDVLIQRNANWYFRIHVFFLSKSDFYNELQNWATLVRSTISRYSFCSYKVGQVEMNSNKFKTKSVLAPQTFGNYWTPFINIYYQYYNLESIWFVLTSVLQQKAQACAENFMLFWIQTADEELRDTRLL